MTSTKVAMWKAPARREYQPKPMDPGQVVVWTVRIDAHWTVPPRYDSGSATFTEGIGWVGDVEYERIGTVWSQATSASSWWVVPEDGDPEPVVVRRAGKSWKHHFPEGTLYQSGECAGWRDGIRRAENIRRRGVYAVVDSEYTSRSGGWGPATTWTTVKWHCDPDCPGAAGKPLDDGTGPGYGDWDVHSITDVLVGRVHLPSAPPFCAQCIMLEPAPAVSHCA
jgi:hypothetical protein